MHTADAYITSNVPVPSEWEQVFPPVDWHELVHEGGYYDQSHLIHDFNHFLGLSPAQYLKLQSTVCIASGCA